MHHINKHKRQIQHLFFSKWFLLKMIRTIQYKRENKTKREKRLKNEKNETK